MDSTQAAHESSKPTSIDLLTLAFGVLGMESLDLEDIAKENEVCFWLNLGVEMDSSSTVTE